MSEEGKKSAATLTTGFTTVAQIRREKDVHEAVYGHKDLLIPTIVLIACGILGFVLSVL